MTSIGEVIPSSLPARALARVGTPGGWTPPSDEELEAERLQREAENREHDRQMNRDRFASACPRRFDRAHLDDVPGDHGDSLRQWADDPQGRNVLLAGTVGCGKTHAAIAAVRRWADCDTGPASLHITTAVELLDTLRPGHTPVTSGGERGRDPYEQATRVGVLLLDDVGAERPTDWTAERLAAVVDRRWLDELPIVATTNLTLGPKGQLIEAVGERTYSRLVGSGAVVLRMTGADRRRS